MADGIEKLILGTVQFGLDYGINNPKGRPSENEVFAILNSANEQGIRWLDTAAAYGDAEQRIGSFLQQAAGVDFDIISKFHFSDNTAPATILQASLNRLGVPSIHTYLYHSFKDLQEHPETLRELEALRDAGAIKHLGVSVYTNAELKAACGNPAIGVIQLPFNLLDNDSQRGDLLQEAKEKGKVVHTRSVFLQGLFFKPLGSLSAQFAPLIPHLQFLDKIRQDEGLSWAQICLAYPCSKPYIDGVLIGVDSVEQLVENIEALKKPLPAGVIQKIDEIRVSATELLNPSNWKK